MSETTTPEGGATPTGGPTPEGAKPDGPTDGGAKPTGGPDDAGTLGDKGKAALDREREARREAERRAADAERALHDLQDAGKSEVERAIARLDRQSAELETASARVRELEADVARRELLELKRSIASEFGIPADAAHRLQGSDTRSLRADAERYIAEREASERPGDIGVGRGGTAGARPSADMNRLLREASGRTQ
jgi:hypothetical protein